MFGKNRALVLVVALAAALVMLLGFASVSFASGETTDEVVTTCVDGYVINHREVAVDGVKAGLLVMAINDTGKFEAPVGADGYFKFEKLPVGDSNFILDLPEGWAGIVPLADRGGVAETGATTIEKKDKCQRIVFKIRRDYEVIVIKWEELLDGSVQPGEGWKITATPVKDPFVKAQTGTTDKDGYVGFTLTAGKWVIAETVKAGWQPITPKSVTIDLDPYGPVGAMDPIVFKNRTPACYNTLIVEKMGFGTDANGSEVLLGPLAGWKVTVSRADGAMVPITKVTDGSGKATFAHLMPGVYKVKETVQVGWEALDENPQTVVFTGCVNDPVTVRISNKETQGVMKIYGKKLFKAWVPPYKGELVGLAGWKITATLVGTEVVTSTVTNALGDYLFPQEQLVAAGMGFPGATIEVCEEDRDHWIHVSPKCVKVTFPYPLPEDYAGAKVNFVNQEDPPATGTAGGSCQAYHAIAKGETLARIAARYGVTINSLVLANGIKNADVIYAGQNLCIP